MQEGSNRGGTRGGQADFSWEIVREDKQRDHYLGNSVHAPKGRWAEGRDIQWYNRGHHDKEDRESRRKEIMDVKQAEREAMERMLGRGSSTKDDPSGSARTGANAAPIDPSKRRYPPAPELRGDRERRHSRHHREERSHRGHDRERSPHRSSPRERHRHRHHHRRDHDELRHRE